MGPNWLVVKEMGHKGCSDRDAVIARVGHVSHHLGSLLGAIELIVLCTFRMQSRTF